MHMEEKGDKSESGHGPCSSFGLCMRKHPFGSTNKISPSEVEVSSERHNVVDADQIISNVRSKATANLLEHIKKMVLNNPTERLPLFKKELEKLVAAFTEFGIDPSPVKLRVDKLMRDIASYIAMQSATSGKLAPEVQRKRLDDNKSGLDSAFELHAAELARNDSLRTSLASAELRREKLRREQERLEAQIDKLRHSISRSGEQIDKHKGAIDCLLKQNVEIVQTPVLSPKDAKALKKMQDSIESQRNVFKDFTLG